MDLEGDAVIGRRSFFRLAAVASATAALAPSVVVQAAERSLEPAERPRELWCENGVCWWVDLTDEEAAQNALDLADARARQAEMVALESGYQYEPLRFGSTIHIPPYASLTAGPDAPTVLEPGQQFELVGLDQSHTEVTWSRPTAEWANPMHVTYWTGSAWARLP